MPNSSYQAPERPLGSCVHALQKGSQEDNSNGHHNYKKGHGYSLPEETDLSGWGEGSGFPGKDP